MEAAWVTISTRHPEVPAAVVVTGTGGNRKGHAAADLAGVPDMPGCPVRELAGELTPRLAALGEARPSQNPLFCAPKACRACHQSLGICFPTASANAIFTARLRSSRR